MTNWLRDVILGGQDGLVNVLGISLGLSAVTSNVKIILAAGLAATFTESISMGAVAYTSSLAERDHYRGERQRERDEIHDVPEIERDEVRQIYAARGFSGELLEQVVDQITSDEETWLDVMMSDELHLEPVDTNDVLRTSVVVTLAAVIGSLIPLLPFFFFGRVVAVPLCVALSAVTLLCVGAYQGASLSGSWKRSAVQLVVIGLGAAALGFLVDRLFGANA